MSRGCATTFKDGSTCSREAKVAYVRSQGQTPEPPLPLAGLRQAGAARQVGLLRTLDALTEIPQGSHMGDVSTRTGAKLDSKP